MKYLAWFLIGLAAVSPAAAQDAEPRRMRLIAVGDAPPHREEIRDGVRVQLPPPPGSVPPGALQVVAAPPEDDSDAEVEELGQLTMRLGYLSEEYEVPAGARSVSIRREDGSVWESVGSPESGDFIVILWRDPDAGDWSEARSLVVPDRDRPRLLTCVNVGRVPVAMILDSERLGLAPGRIIRRRLEAGDPVPLRMAIPNERDGFDRILQTGIEPNGREQNWVITYQADGMEIRDPVKVKKFRTRVR